MDLIQNQDLPINPERRDSSTIKNREDVGLGRVDNLSAADLLRLMGEKTRDEVNKTDHHKIGASTDLYELFSVSEPSYVSFFISVTSKTSTSEYTSGVAKIDLLISNTEIKSKVISFGMTGAKLLIYGNSCVLKLPSLPGDGSVINEVETCYYHFKESSFSPVFKLFSSGYSPRKEIPLEEITQAVSLSVFDPSGQIVPGYPYRDSYDYPTINGVPFTGEQGELRNIEITAKHPDTDRSGAGQHDWEVLEDIPVTRVSISDIEEDGVTIRKADTSVSKISQRASEEFGLCKTIGSWEYGSGSPVALDSVRAIFNSLEGNDDDVITLGFLKSVLFPLYRNLAEKTTTPGYSSYFMYEVHIGSSVPSGVIEVPSTGKSTTVTFSGYSRCLDSIAGYPDQSLTQLYNDGKLVFSGSHPHVIINEEFFPNVTFSMSSNSSTDEIVEEVILSTTNLVSTPKAEYRLKFIQAPSEIAKEGYLIYRVDEELPEDTLLDSLALRGGSFYENLSDCEFLLSADGASATEEAGSGGRYAIFLAKKSENGNITIDPDYGSSGDVGSLVPLNNRSQRVDNDGEYTETTEAGLTWGYELFSDESLICNHDATFSLLDFKAYPKNVKLNKEFLGEVGLYRQPKEQPGPHRPKAGLPGKTMRLQIYQEAMEPKLTVDTTSVNLPYSESTGVGRISYASDFDVELIPEAEYSWISYTQQFNSFYFNVLANPGIQARTAYYKITNGYIDIEVSVTQQGQGVHWSIEGFDDTDTPVFNFLPEGETRTIRVASNVSYYIHGVKTLESGDWPLVYLGSQLITEDSRFGLDGETTTYDFQVYVPQNSLSGDNRSKTITLVNSEDDGMTKDIVISQSKYTDLAIRISPEILTFQPVGVQTNTVLITSTSQYTLIPDSDWLQAIPESGGRLGFLTENEPIQIKCLSDNPSASTRVGYVKVYESVDGVLVQRGSLTVRQVGNLVLSALFSGESSTISLPVAGGVAQIMISTNADGWEVASEVPSWVTLSALSGSASTQVVNAVVSENTSLNTRSCDITFVSRYGGQTGGASGTVSITQSAGTGTVVTYEYIGTTASGVTPSIRGTKTSYGLRVQSKYYKITTINGVERSREVITETPPTTAISGAILVDAPTIVLNCSSSNNIVTVSNIPQNTSVSDKTHTLRLTYLDRGNTSRSVDVSFISTRIVSLESVCTLNTGAYTGTPVVDVLPGMTSVIKFRAIPEFSGSRIDMNLGDGSVHGSWTETSLSTNTSGQYEFTIDPGAHSEITLVLQGRIDGENVTYNVPILIRPALVIEDTHSFHPCSDAGVENTGLWLTSDISSNTILDTSHAAWIIGEYGEAPVKRIIREVSGNTHWVFREQGHVTPDWIPYVTGHTGTGGSVQVIRFLKSDTYNTDNRIYLIHNSDNTVSLGGLEGSLWSVDN